jgi:hypothetical protein
MTALSETQAWLAEVLRQRRALPKDPHVTEQATRVATGNDRLSPVEQVEIYREQFWLRHTSSLVDDYAGLSGIIGQEDWERLAEEYLEAHPPTSYTLRNLGDRLPEFLQRCEWLPHRDLCVDMARLEWAYIEVFDAADSPPLDPARLTAIPESAWEHARLSLNPAQRRLRLRFPVADLRKQLRTSEQPVPIPAPHAQNLVVYRATDRNLYHAELSDGAFALLEALAEGLPLVPAFERAVRAVPSAENELGANLSTWFQEWAARAWIVDVATAQSTSNG